MVVEGMGKKGDSTFRKEKIPAPPKKVIIRKLPSSFTEEDFKNAVCPLPEHNYFYFAASDKSLGTHAFSRAYINFVNVEDVFTFRDQFDGYVFLDQKGNEYPALVEYASFQKIPKQSSLQRKDPRSGTIDEDQDYLSFVDSIENPEIVALPQMETLLEEIENKERELRANHGVLKIKTPLLEFIEKRNAERILSAERRRKKELERKKAREEERKRRKELGRKREEQFQKEDRERANRKLKERELRDKERIGKRDREKSEWFAQNTEEKMGHASVHSVKTVRDCLPTKLKGSVVETQKEEMVKSKRYSEARKLNEREKKIKEMRFAVASTKDTTDLDICPSIEGKSQPQPDDVNQSQVICDKKADAPSLTEEKVGKKICEVDYNSDDCSYASQSVDLNIFKTHSVEEDQKPKEDASKSSKGEHLGVASTDDSSGSNKESKCRSLRDPRTERRIRNKDRPDMQLYRPGQSRLKSSTRSNAGDNSTKGTDSSSASTSPFEIDMEEIRDDKPKDLKELMPVEKFASKNITRQTDLMAASDDKLGQRQESECGNDSDGIGVELEQNEDPFKRSRKGYSYHHERESKAKSALKTRESNSELKCMTFQRSISQE